MDGHGDAAERHASLMITPSAALILQTGKEVNQYVTVQPLRVRSLDDQSQLKEVPYPFGSVTSGQCLPVSFCHCQQCTCKPKSCLKSHSIQISVFQIPVLESKTLLFPLAPLLIIEIDVCSLKREERKNIKQV